jgi:maltooligosyltrehalose trehalohydrolase
MVALTGRAEAYYSDTTGHAQEFVSSARHGYLFQGQHYAWQQMPRGAPTDGIPVRRFVTFLQNHDQVANSAHGERGDRLTSPAKWRAMTALLLLGPGTPMLFQGQEFGASAPFLYFADFDPELAAAVKIGRAQFLAQFPSVVDYEAKAPLADPGDRRTFERCKLDRREREAHAEPYALHRDLLRLRREHAAFSNDGDRRVDGAVLSESAFVLRFFHAEGDRLLVVNLGRDIVRSSFAEPLLAPPAGRDWDVVWSSEHPQYGGGGTRVLWPEWWIGGESALVLGPVPQRPRVAIVSRRTA